MGKSGYTKARIVTDKVNVKGVLSVDGFSITYVGADKEERVVPVSECLAVFKGKPIDLSISLKSEGEIPDAAE